VLEQIIFGVVSALLDWLEKRASTPNTLTDANTPKDLRDRFDAYVLKRMHDIDDSNRQQQGHSEADSAGKS